MATYVYRAGKNGEIKAQLLTRQRRVRFEGFVPFKQRMRQNLYNLECEQGSRFKIPGYSTDTLKRVWNE